MRSTGQNSSATDIPLGFATCRLYEKSGELHYDMWPAFGTMMGNPLYGAVADMKVLCNTDDMLMISKGAYRYIFRFKARPAGPDALTYSVKLFGILPAVFHWGDISSEGKQALRAAFGGPRG
jgi:hypothetical protein